MRIGELLRTMREEAATRRLNPRDADLLLSDVLQKPAAWLIAHDDEEVSAEDEDAYTDLLARRFRGEPLQYIRGRCEFYGREFLTDRRALIPRPETEHLVESAVSLIPRNGRVIDVGTGSGCISVSVALERPDLTVYATDISIEALLVARSNRDRLGASVELFVADSVRGFQGPFDAILSNPPYIPAKEIPYLQSEVREHEPRVALTTGGEGLDVVRELVDSAPSLLTPEGRLFMEIGYQQRDAVQALASDRGWGSIRFVDDLAAIPRMALLEGVPRD
ncbi:MAG: peptide chain release factor N(5)-glutamine methyltransferase [Acidobacteria bacterium]|nr:peptide chain release factor N(5)-glutamine methyltransferase [Acidobacteriota bacterium]